VIKIIIKSKIVQLAQFEIVLSLNREVNKKAYEKTDLIFMRRHISIGVF